MKARTRTALAAGAGHAPPCPSELTGCVLLQMPLRDPLNSWGASCYRDLISPFAGWPSWAGAHRRSQGQEPWKQTHNVDVTQRTCSHLERAVLGLVLYRLQNPQQERGPMAQCRKFPNDSSFFPHLVPTQPLEDTLRVTFEIKHCT